MAEPESHGPDCQCTRCRGFQPGHDLSVRHGAYAELALSPRAETLAARLREAAVHLTAADEAGLAVAALSALQLSIATGALEEVTEAIERGDDVDVWLGRLESRARLSQDARGWSNTVRQWFDSLGLTPTGRQALEEKTVRVIHEHEVKAAFEVWFRISLRYIDRGVQEAFFDEVWAAIEEAESQAVGVRELPPVTDANGGEAGP